MAGRPDGPNILVIMSDQHSRHVVGCYGDELVRTPNLDSLTAEGVRFTDAYCASPVSCPSRMSFMTGRTPSHNRVWNNQHELNPGTPTWAHALGVAGYETSLLGRMHFEGPDQYHGFENRPIGEFFAVHPGVVPVRERYPSGQSRTVMKQSGHGTTTYQWHDDRIAAATRDYLLARGARRDKPFAAVASFVLPHCPFVAPQDLFDYYHERVDIPDVEPDQPAMIRAYRRSRGIDEPLPEHTTRAARAAYFGLCEYFDGLVGQVLNALDDAGLTDDTLVVYCSDHGEMAGEHGCWTKNTYYEGSVGVPLMARLPGVALAGTVCERVCSLIDLAPTLCEVAGVEPPPGCDGRSLWPLMQGSAGAWVDEAFSEVTDELAGGHTPSRMIRAGDWKLWAHLEPDGNLPVALFNLADDPGELRSLSDDPSLTARRDELTDRLTADWDPEAVRQASLAMDRDYRYLREWGRALQPRLPEQMAPPPGDLEDDVLIVGK